AEPLRPGQPFARARRRRIAAAERAEAGEAREAEDEQAVGEIAEPASGEQAQRHQAPEGGIAEALGVAAVERAEDRVSREQGADDAERPLQGDHDGSPPSPRTRGSSSAVAGFPLSRE